MSKQQQTGSYKSSQPQSTPMIVNHPNTLTNTHPNTHPNSNTNSNIHLNNLHNLTTEQLRTFLK